MMVPTLHLNGTSPDELRDTLSEAVYALTSAIEAVEKTAPNGRDFYPQGPAAIGEAVKEYRGRMALLDQVKRELQELQVAICDAAEGGAQ